jgi:tryptophan halogenase
LPCDRAVAVPKEMNIARPPYTEASALSAGWRWRIPLQHRAGNGCAYSSAHIGDSDALHDLLTEVAEKPLGEPWFLCFTTGRRKLFWNRNCIALGLASGFLEPLESTSIHLVMSGVYKLLEYFPTKAFAQSNSDSYNDELIAEIERIRDFIVLHYCMTEREDSPLCAHCRSFYIFEGMGVCPDQYDPLMDVVNLPGLRDVFYSLAQSTAIAAQSAPSHDSYFGAGPGGR